MQEDWTDKLPRPPREAYTLLEEARELGYWLRWARYEHHARQDGGRYRITRPHSLDAIVTTDDIDTVRAFLSAEARKAVADGESREVHA